METRIPPPTEISLKSAKFRVRVSAKATLANSTNRHASTATIRFMESSQPNLSIFVNYEVSKRGVPEKVGSVAEGLARLALFLAKPPHAHAPDTRTNIVGPM